MREKETTQKRSLLNAKSRDELFDRLHKDDMKKQKENIYQTT
jgi:hypothetical protein